MRLLRSSFLVAASQVQFLQSKMNELKIQHTPNIQWSGKNMKIAVDTPVQKGRKPPENISHWSTAIVKFSRAHVTSSLISPGSGFPCLLALLSGFLAASSESSFIFYKKWPVFRAK